MVCGRQNIALPGKTESRSNFRAIIDYQAEKDDLLSDHLATHCTKRCKILVSRNSE